LLSIFGLKYVSATVSAAYIYTQPVMVMFFAVLFSLLGWAADYTHTITAERIVYMLFIFTGVYLVSLHKAKK
jgi:drug/metabolite transporter (DMT)-like permease